MIIGILVNTVAYFKKSRGEPCQVSDENIRWSFFMYFTYFLLFFNFFYNAYIVKSSKSKQAAAAAAEKKNDQAAHANGHSLVNGKSYLNGNANGHVKHDYNNNVYSKSNGTNGVKKNIE